MPDKDLEYLHPEIKEEVKHLRSLLRTEAEKITLANRFQTWEDGCKVVILDLKTMRSTEVPLYAYSEVRKVLETLLGGK